MEKLVFLVIVAAVSAISNWLKKRGQSSDAQDGSNTPPLAPSPTRTNPQAPRPAAPRPVKPTNWEEELRRLLGGGDSPPAAPPRVPPMRPVVITPTPLPPVAP